MCNKNLEQLKEKNEETAGPAVGTDPAVRA